MPTPPEKYAFHLFQSSHITPNLEKDFGHFSTIVCNAALTAEQIEEVQSRLPNALLLAAIDAMEVPPPDWEYGIEFNAAFPRSALWFDAEGDPFTLIGYGQSYSLTAQAILFWFGWAESLHAKGFRNIYIDQFAPEIPPWRFGSFTGAIDIDGDGVPDTFEEARSIYKYGSPCLSQIVRLAIPGATIVGNTGIGRVDSALNGISLEETFTTRAFADAIRVTPYTPLNIAWCANQAQVNTIRTMRAVRPLLEPVQIGQHTSFEIPPKP